MLGGRLEVKLFASGEVVSAFESIDAVGAGTVEMGHGSPYYWKGKAAASQFVSNIPFGLTAQDTMPGITMGEARSCATRSIATHWVASSWCAENTGAQHPGWCVKEINTLADFKGLKMRMPGIGAEVMSQAGATVVNLPGSEVAPALASGTVDFINNKEWDKLPDDLKAIVEQCAYSTTQVMLSEFVGRSGPVLDEFVNKHGVIIKKLSDDILQTLGGIAGEVISDLAAKDPMSKKVFASLAKFRNLQLAYSDATEGDFLKARGLPYEFPTG